MERQKVTLKVDGMGFGTVTLDDMDLSNYVESVSIFAKGDEPPQVVLTLAKFVEVEADLPEAAASIVQQEWKKGATVSGRWVNDVYIEEPPEDAGPHYEWIPEPRL